MLKKVLLVGAVALGLSAAAFANGTADENVAAVPQFNPGIYAGVQLGYALTGWKTMWNAGDMVNVNKANSFAGRVYAGYDFHKNFALEAGYFLAFSKAKARNLADSADAANILTQAADLLLKVKIPLADSWGIYTKVGLGYLTSKVRDVTAGYALKSAKNFNVAYGAGVNYDITSNWTTDLSWMHYTGNTNVNSKNLQPSLNFFALGISYKFNF
ncbi:MAG: outer membrane beta-barrel protein [Gammaproteobacteria bacterium]|jgi:opacity protein-like surface antigen